jgi:hypothetical protein
MRLHGFDPSASPPIAKVQTRLSIESEHDEPTLETWLDANPKLLLDEALLVFSRQHPLGVGKPDLIALDQFGNLVVIEVKTGRSGTKSASEESIIGQPLSYAQELASARYGDLDEMYQRYRDRVVDGRWVAEQEHTLADTLHDAFESRYGRRLTPDQYNNNQSVVIVAETITARTADNARYLLEQGYSIQCREVQLFEYHTDDRHSTPARALVTHTVVDDFDASDSITKSVTVQPGPRGFISESYGPDYNRCVVNLEEQFKGENGLDIRNKDLGFGIKHPKIPDPLINGNHVQGVARLRDSGGLGRMVITNSGTSNGFRLAFQDVADADEEWFSSSNTLPDSVSFDIRNVSRFGNHGHPGGVQAQGDIVAIAMEGGDADHAAIYFLKIDGKDIEHVRTLWLNGSRGEPLQADQNNAATVGLVKLASNNHLLAVS